MARGKSQLKGAVNRAVNAIARRSGTKSNKARYIARGNSVNKTRR